MLLHWLLPIEQTESIASAPSPTVIAEAVLPLISKASQTKSDAMLVKCKKCSESYRKDLSKLEEHYITAAFAGGLLFDFQTPSSSEPQGKKAFEGISMLA